MPLSPIAPVVPNVLQSFAVSKYIFTLIHTYTYLHTHISVSVFSMSAASHYFGKSTTKMHDSKQTTRFASKTPCNDINCLLSFCTMYYNVCTIDYVLCYCDMQSFLFMITCRPPADHRADECLQLCCRPVGQRERNGGCLWSLSRPDGLPVSL